jgi:hypothetical protein
MSDRQQLAEVNHNIRDLAAKLDRDDVSSWEFICECGEKRCTERIRLPLARYDELKKADAALLAPGHPQERPAQWASGRRRPASEPDPAA